MLMRIIFPRDYESQNNRLGTVSATDDSSQNSVEKRINLHFSDLFDGALFILTGSKNPIMDRALLPSHSNRDFFLVF